MEKIDYESVFHYSDGNLYWKKPTGRRVRFGDLAGNVSEGYVSIRVGGKLMKAHRIIYFMHHGYMPREIDHIDGNGLNNRIDNLRDADRFVNNKNRSASRNNKSGIKNVCWSKVANKWHVSIMENKTRHHIGYFASLDDARFAADNARKQYHGEFARHN